MKFIHFNIFKLKQETRGKAKLFQDDTKFSSEIDTFKMYLDTNTVTKNTCI